MKNLAETPIRAMVVGQKAGHVHRDLTLENMCAVVIDDNMEK